MKQLAQLAILVLLAWTLTHIYLMNSIITQQEQNISLLGQFGQLKLDALESRKKSVMAYQSRNQLHFITHLQDNNFRMASAIKEIVESVPPSISLINIKATGNVITLSATASSDLDIVNFMKKITEHSLFQQPVLTAHSADHYFQLQVNENE